MRLLGREVGAAAGEEPSAARSERLYWPNFSGILVTIASERTSPVAHMWE